jgi:hypothetical protein
MKKYFLPTTFVVLVITLTGCYTVTWNPRDNDFPTKDKSLEAGNNSYAESGYDFYDNTPWWWEITPPTFVGTDNSGQDLESTSSPIIIYYGNPMPFIPPPPVGVPIDPVLTPPVITPTPVKPTENNKAQDVRPRDNTNNSSTNTRNDSGSRNTDTRRKR